MDKQLLHVPCYNCGADKPTFYLAENGFNIDRCSNCGLLYMSERPSDEVIENATAIGQHHGDKDLDANVYYNRSIIPHYEKVIRDAWAKDLPNVDSWLDIGCGHGEFIETLQSVSGGRLSVRGSEPNLAKQESAAKRGLDIRLIDIDSHGQQYDVVSLLNVYSHLPDPKQFIADLRKLIRPGGEFFFQTGDVAEFSAEKILKPLSLPDHMSFASEKIIRSMLTELGFDVKSIYKYPNLPMTPFSLAKEVAKFFLPRKVSYLRYYLDWKAHSQSRMYVRAVWQGAS